MPHSTMDFSQRATLTERMDEPCSREEMRACLGDIAKLNRWSMGYLPTMNWLNALKARCRCCEGRFPSWMWAAGMGTS